MAGKASTHSTFYDQAVETTAKASPYTYGAGSVDGTVLSETYNKQKTLPLIFWKNKGKTLQTVRSIMNENVGVNYRTIYNGYLVPGQNASFTQYDDYLRCISSSESYNEYLKDKRNPTYANIIKRYNERDTVGLARYKMQDFIYLKYYNQIPNNHMITLRRYAQPVPDHMISLDISSKDLNANNNFPEEFCAIATAVTYMGEQTGNKMSEILKFDYGARWESKTAQVNQLQSTDGGLAAQMKDGFLKVSADIKDGSHTGHQVTDAIKLSVISALSGKQVSDMQASQNAYPNDAYLTQYGEEFYGDLNSITETSMRARGLTFTNSFSLNFEYSLKSLKCVNPRVAMMDILSNFLLLTGNYGSFWGGETIYFGVNNIGPQFGDPELLRQGKYGQYLNTLADSIKQGFDLFKEKNTKKDGSFSIGEALGNLLKGGMQALLGNLLGGNIGVAGTAQAPPALLSGEPTGFWHLTIGNPLDPIAMMGNMKIEKTSVQFNDTLGYDDFPTEIKFTVEMSHGKPRDNSGIESMFNGNKGRFYVLSKDLSQAFDLNYRRTTPNGFQAATTDGNQEASMYAVPRSDGNEGTFTTGKLKIVGGMLN